MAESVQTKKKAEHKLPASFMALQAVLIVIALVVCWLLGGVSIGGIRGGIVLSLVSFLLAFAVISTIFTYIKKNHDNQ